MKSARIVAPILAVLLAFSFAFAQDAKKVQKVKLTFDEKGYVVTPAKLAKDVPVEMDVDLTTVKGCMRTVVIEAFNVNKKVADGDTKITFTPNKAGEIDMHCGMNMGKGKFTVVAPK